MKKLLLLASIALAVLAPDLRAADAIDAAVDAATRTPENSARDRYRHPAETLRFFQVEPEMTVVEIWPGGGWYTEILAPLLAADGKLYAAAFSDKAEGQPAYRARLNKALREKIAANPDIYG